MWAPQTVTDILSIERVQRRATKFILSLPYRTATTYRERLRHDIIGTNTYSFTSRGVASPKLVGGGPNAQYPDILCIERQCNVHGRFAPPPHTFLPGFERIKKLLQNKSGGGPHPPPLPPPPWLRPCLQVFIYKSILSNDVNVSIRTTTRTTRNANPVNGILSTYPHAGQLA